MKKREVASRLLALLAVSAVLVACGAGLRHPEFTADRVLALRVGLTTDSVVVLFGKPDRTQAMTCGSQTPKPWQCLIWEYDLGPHPKGRFQFSTNHNRLTFSLDVDPPRLNDWNIDLMYDGAMP